MNISGRIKRPDADIAKMISQSDAFSELPPPEVVASGLSIEAFTGELR